MQLLKQYKIKEQFLLFIILFSLAVFFFLLTFFSDATFDAGDGIRHYLMARYSWQHPWILLDLWAKPLFTFLLSFFAMFGMAGANIFQILCAVLSSYFCFRIAQRLEIANVLLIPVFIFFAPIYFAVINSGLTEPFFGLTVVCAIFLLVEKKYIWSAIIISFLPFARNEGFLFLPVFALVFLLRKKYVSIFLLATGTVILSIIGFFVFKDILWLFSHNPYKGHQDIYGHGELLYFVKEYNSILGRPLSFLFLSGLLWMGFKIIKIKKSFQTNSFFSEELFLIFGCLMIYFVGHSIFWWKGLFSSFGLSRMMAGVVPLAALICLRGFNFLLLPVQKFLQGKSLFLGTIFLLLFCVALVCRIPFKQWYFPFKLGMEEKVVQAAGEWYKKSGIKNKKIYFLHPFLPHALELDPFDGNVMQELWGLDKEHPEKNIEDNALIFWDAHYSPNEGQIKLPALTGNSHFELLQTVKPGVDYITLGGNNFEVYLFLKKNTGESFAPSVVSKTDILFIDSLKQENASVIMNMKTLLPENSGAASFHFMLNDSTEYGPGLIRKISDLKNSKAINYINVKAVILTKDFFKDVFLIFEITDSDDKQLLWDREEIQIGKNEIGQKKNIDIAFPVSPELFRDKNNFKIYIWNHGRKNFLISDMEIVYNSKIDGNTIIVW